MKKVIKRTCSSFTGMGIMALIACMALCHSLSACSKADEASVEEPAVEVMDQPEDTADAPAVGEELPEADEAGDADAAASDAGATADEAPAAQASDAETPADEAPAAQASDAETPDAAGN